MHNKCDHCYKELDPNDESNIRYMLFGRVFIDDTKSARKEISCRTFYVYFVLQRISQCQILCKERQNCMCKLCKLISNNQSIFNTLTPYNPWHCIFVSTYSPNRMQCVHSWSLTNLSDSASIIIWCQCNIIYIIKLTRLPKQWDRWNKVLGDQSFINMYYKKTI
jgi:hypothetical protein